MTAAYEPWAVVSAQLAELMGCVGTMQSQLADLTTRVDRITDQLAAKAERGQLEAIADQVTVIADKLTDSAEFTDAIATMAYATGAQVEREHPSRPAGIDQACGADPAAGLQRVEAEIGDARVIRLVTPGSAPPAIWASMQDAAVEADGAVTA